MWTGWQMGNWSSRHCSTVRCTSTEESAACCSTPSTRTTAGHTCASSARLRVRLEIKYHYVWCQINVLIALSASSATYELKCLLSSEEVTSCGKLKVIPSIEPLFTRKLDVLEVIEGRNARFDCKVSGTPPPKVIWSHFGRGKIDTIIITVRFKLHALCEIAVSPFSFFILFLTLSFLYRPSTKREWGHSYSSGGRPPLSHHCSCDQRGWGVFHGHGS